MIREGEDISIDGATGDVFQGRIQTVDSDFAKEEDLQTLLGRTDSFRRLKVLSNADSPRDAQRSVDFGAEGIGLCRTEHMFMEQKRLPIMQKMVLAKSKEERQAALGQLLSAQHGLPSEKTNTRPFCHIPYVIVRCQIRQKSCLLSCFNASRALFQGFFRHLILEGETSHEEVNMRPRFPSIMGTTASSTSVWWFVVIAGIAAMVVGVLLLISPGTTLFVLVQFLGAYWLVTGALAFASLCIDRSLWGWKLVTGILGVVAGLSVLRNPLWSAIFVPKLLVVFLAIDAFVMGMTQNIHAFRGGGFSLAILGIMNVIFAIILLLNPLIGVFLLPIVLGIIAVIGGGLAAIRAFASRPRQTPLQPPGPQPV